MNQPTVFISYSHKDEDWKDRLVTHLRVLQKEGLFDLWDDRRIEAGEDWHQKISDAMNAAGAAMLLITADFLTSAFILKEEVPRLIERKDHEGLSIFPVIVKPCAWKKVKWLSRMQVRPEDGKPLSSGDEFQIDTFLTTIAEEVAEITGKSKASLGDKPLTPGKLDPIWNVPQRRNSNFTGREAVLSKLADDLNSGTPAALTQTIAGLGGIGKTQIALEYAYRNRSEYEAIWWLRAEEEETLAADYAAFATAAGMPEKDAQEEQIIVKAVRRWLEHNPKWLFIFDNAQKPEDIHDYLPGEPTGHVLITSRHQAWGKLGRSFNIDIWSRSESVDFLFKRTNNIDRPFADTVAKKLGDLPLALEQAAAYVNETSIGFSDYLKLFRARRNELWDEELSPLDYPTKVATTWSLAIEKVREEVPTGALVLNLCSYFSPDEIPRSLISDASEYLPEDFSPLFKDTIALNKGIKALNHYSLIVAQPDSLSVHRLVQAVVRDRLKAEDQKLCAEAAVRTVNAVFPADGNDNPNSWPECIALLSHGRVVIEHADQNKVALEDEAALLNKIASYLHGRAAYKEAEPLFRRALDIREKQLGADHPDVANSLNNLALLLKDQGSYPEAEPLFRRALDIRETQLGADHPDVAQSLNNLALLLQDQGKYAEAEPLSRRALEICETQLGVEPRYVAQSLNNLALLLKDQGKYAEAEPLFRQALEIYETQLGVEHPYVANSLNGLALLLKDQGKYAEAEPLFRRALEICETQLGVEHPYVANSLNGLALLLKDQGKYAEAEPLFRRALEIYETQLGVEHPYVANSLNGLALLLKDQGKYAEAEPLFRRALEICETQLGVEHPYVANSLNGLALLLKDQGKYAEAEPLFRRALEICETQLGKSHPSTNTVRGNLENLLLDMKSMGDQ